MNGDGPKLVKVDDGLYVDETFERPRARSTEELREIAESLRKPRPRVDFSHMTAAIALEAFYRQVQEQMLKSGHILSRKEFMALGFSIVVPPPTLLKLSQIGLPFAVVQQQPQVPTPNQIARQNLRNPLSSIKRG